ncbi:hypothetical protein ZYGR_0E00860 [Zygosaccharomyces rouxii]|uniref:Uncharacterized protein n=1 Tax=Zygosaccharomyces rouxii TaxID=4956 RepID=A0A1Q2ZU80_ZYGRO|nr:hypothetical protein ZYGR_0E00860 [Zygosaccharomyces rouxii]
MNIATLNVAKQPIVTSVSLETTEFSTNAEGIAAQEAVKKLVVTPAYGVKNSNPIIDEAIDNFSFLYSEPKSKSNKIQFGESRTITFDVDEEVDRLASKTKNTENQSKDSKPLKTILKPGPVFVHDSELLETEDFAYLDESDEETQVKTSNQDVITLLQRIFTLHGIPPCEIKEDLLGTLQRLARGVVASFKQREQCYKYVGRKQSIEELDELEYVNDKLKCEVAGLNKKLSQEKVRWEVVDEVFIENDSLKAKVEELITAKQHLLKELQLAPKWEDVDGLLEEDKELKSRVKQLTFLNDDLKKKYAQIEITTSKRADELVSSKEKSDIELRKTDIKLNETTEQVIELRREKEVLNAKLYTYKKNAETTSIKLEETEERVQELSKIVEDYRTKNGELGSSCGQLVEKAEQTAIKLRNTELVNVELVSTRADLTSKLHGVKRTVDYLTSENIEMTKKMKLMKKKAYNRFFDQNVSLGSKNEELAEKLGQALNKLEEFGNLQKDYEKLDSKNNELAANQDELTLTNKNLSQRLEAETKRVKQLENDFTMAQDKVISFDISLRRVRQWYEALSQEKHDTDVKVCQLESLYREINSRSVSLDDELESAKTCSIKSVQKVEQSEHRIERDEQLVQDSERWKMEGQSCFQEFSILRNEHSTLLQKCSKLEFEKSKLQTENVELSGYKEGYSLFDEKYEWLESIALSLKQEKKCSDDKIKDLQRELKYARKTIDSMEKAKSQYERRPQELQIQLDRLRLQNFELSQRFGKKNKELQESFDKMREMAVMLRSTMSLAKTLSPSDEVTLVEQPNNNAGNTLKTFLPLKWWKTST